MISDSARHAPVAAAIALSPPIAAAAGPAEADAALEQARTGIARLAISSANAHRNNAFGSTASLVGVVGKYMYSADYIERRDLLLTVLAPDMPDAQAADSERNAATQAADGAIRKICNGEVVLPDQKLRSLLADVHSLENLQSILYDVLPSSYSTYATRVDEETAKQNGRTIVHNVLTFLGTYCPNLRRLNLSALSVLLPDHLRLLSRLPFLNTLLLPYCDINDAHVAALEGLPLEKCSLTSTGITGSTLNCLHRGITVLDLGRCESLTDAGVAKLGEERDAHGNIIRPAMQFTECSLPPHIKPELYQKFARAGSEDD